MPSETRQTGWQDEPLVHHGVTREARYPGPPPRGAWGRVREPVTTYRSFFHCRRHVGLHLAAEQTSIDCCNTSQRIRGTPHKVLLHIPMSSSFHQNSCSRDER